MENNHSSDWPLHNLPPIDSKEDDVTGAQGYLGGIVQYASYQGDRPYQEDRFLIKCGAPFQDSAVAQKALRDIFKDVAADMRSRIPGSTATVAVITPDRLLNVAYLGDSPLAIITRNPATGAIAIETPLRPHQAGDPAEAARIEAEGGCVIFDRIDGQLMLSRSFGDALYHGVSTEIETFQKDLSAYLDAGREVYVCVASDGMTEAAAPPHFARLVSIAADEGKLHRLADIFATFAYQSGSTDNITALLTKVPQRMEEAVVMAVFDGHGGDSTSDAAQKSFAKKLELPPAL
jgi:serine/threonine protein phosphatase PrpC